MQHRAAWLKAVRVLKATMSVLGHMFMAYFASGITLTNPLDFVKNFPILIVLVLVNVFLILKIPAITASIFSGNSGGHDAGHGSRDWGYHRRTDEVNGEST